MEPKSDTPLVAICRTFGPIRRFLEKNRLPGESRFFWAKWIQKNTPSVAPQHVLAELMLDEEVQLRCFVVAQ